MTIDETDTVAFIMTRRDEYRRAARNAARDTTAQAEAESAADALTQLALDLLDRDFQKLREWVTG